MTDRIRVGVVGAHVGPDGQSWGARAHIPALRALPEIDLVAVCNRHRATAQETAHHFGIPRAFDSVEAMLTQGDLDVVDVCVNAASHHAIVTTALAAGKHLFCEWPLGSTLEESGDLSARAKAAGVRHMVGLQARSAPVFDYMRHLVADGFVGQVLSCSVTGSMAIQPNPRIASTSLIHFGHCVDTLLCVVGAELEAGGGIVSVETRANHLLVTGTLTGGPFVNINIRHIPVFGAGFVLEINGTEGTLVASTDGRDLAARDIRSLGEQLNQAALSGARQGEPIRDMSVPATHRWVPDDVPSGPPLSMAQTWRKFAAGIVSGDPTPPDFAFGLRVHELYARLQDVSGNALTRLGVS